MRSAVPACMRSAVLSARASKASIRAITVSSMRYSQHAARCKTGNCFKMTMRSSEKMEQRTSRLCGCRRHSIWPDPAAERMGCRSAHCRRR